MKRSSYTPYRTTTNVPHRYTVAAHPHWNRVELVGTSTRRAS